MKKIIKFNCGTEVIIDGGMLIMTSSCKNGGNLVVKPETGKVHCDCTPKEETSY